jgi:hypothetical protein
MGLVIAGRAVALVIFAFVYPHWRKWEIAREKKRTPRKVSAGGLVAPFDEVFHPTAYSAIFLWEAEKSIPAPHTGCGRQLARSSERSDHGLSSRDAEQCHFTG